MFSGAYLNKFSDQCLTLAQLKAYSRLHASLPEERNRAGFFKNLDDRRSPKRTLCQLTSVMLCSLIRLHMVIWRCKSWFGFAWPSLEQCSLAQSCSVLIYKF